MRYLYTPPPAQPIMVDAVAYTGHPEQLPDQFRVTMFRHQSGGSCWLASNDNAAGVECRVGDWIVRQPTEDGKGVRLRVVDAQYVAQHFKSV